MKNKSQKHFPAKKSNKTGETKIDKILKETLLDEENSFPTKRNCGTMETDVNKKILTKETFLDSEFDKTNDSVEEIFGINDEDNYYGGDFDENEFDNEAMKAAKKDIEDSGENFEDLGTSEFEKNMNVQDFKDDLKRTNLRLPNDEKEVNKIQNMMDTRASFHNKFGAGSLNEEEFKKRLSEAVIKRIKNLYNK